MFILMLQSLGCRGLGCDKVLKQQQCVSGWHAGGFAQGLQAGQRGSAAALHVCPGCQLQNGSCSCSCCSCYQKRWFYWPCGRCCSCCCCGCSCWTLLRPTLLLLLPLQVMPTAISAVQVLRLLAAAVIGHCLSAATGCSSLVQQLLVRARAGCCLCTSSSTVCLTAKVPCPWCWGVPCNPDRMPVSNRLLL